MKRIRAAMSAIATASNLQNPKRELPFLREPLPLIPMKICPSALTVENENRAVQTILGAFDVAHDDGDLCQSD